MSQPLSGLQYDRYLTSVVIAYQNSDLVAERALFPPVFTPGYKGQFRKVNPTLYLEDKSGPLSPEAPTEYVDQESQLDRYALKRYALAGFVPRALVEESQNVTDLLRETTEDVQARVMTAKERAAATLAETDASFASQVTPGSDKKWDDYGDSGGDPGGDILDAMETVRGRIGVKPNRIQIPEQVWTKMRRNPRLLTLQADIDRGYITIEAFADVIGIPAANVVIAGAVKNTAPEGATASITNIWSDNVQLVYNGMGRTDMRWAACFKPQVATERMRVRRWESPNPLGQNVEVQHRYQLKVIEPQAGILLKDVLN